MVASLIELCMTLHVINRPFPFGHTELTSMYFFFPQQKQLPNDIKILIDYAGCSEN